MAPDPHEKASLGPLRAPRARRHAAQWLKLFTSDDWPPQTHGMSVARPGAYKTACGKGYVDCRPGEPRDLILRTPAIDFFKFGGANWFWYWDEASGSFKGAAMSN